jgi:hypothetical protein
MTSGPHDQYNTANGGTVYANQGTQNIYLNQVIDHFNNGLRALKGKLYPKAVHEFEESVATAAKAGLKTEVGDQIAAAHFHAALALLGGRNPGDRGPEEIERVERHLEQVWEYSHQTSTHQARVLWAIVQEDYYAAYKMPTNPADPSVLRESIDQLGATELEPLVKHIARATGGTWNQLLERAAQYGMALPTPAPTQVVKRVPDPRRPEAVRKYFTRTPAPRSNSLLIAEVVGVVLLVVIALVLHNAATILFLAGAVWLGKLGIEEYQRYQAYLRAFHDAEPKPSDQQVDAWLKEDIAELCEQAKHRVRLNTELKAHGGDLVYPAQIIVGVQWERDLAGYPVRIRRGRDGDLRANAYDVLIMFLTNNLISTYRCMLDFRTGEVAYDEVTEHHYRDIVGVSSLSIPMPKKMADLLAEVDEQYRNIPFAQTFRLSITSGESLSSATGFSRPEDGLTGDIAWASNTMALDIIKKMIRARHTA